MKLLTNWIIRRLGGYTEDEIGWNISILKSRIEYAEKRLLKKPFDHQFVEITAYRDALNLIRYVQKKSVRRMLKWKKN